MTMKQIGLGLLLLASTCGIGWVWQLQTARARANHYEPVEATVVANRIHKNWVNHATERMIQQYQAEYLIEYSYRGQTYHHWESVPLITSQRFRAEAVLGEKGPGTRIPIFVDPADPRRIALEVSGLRAYLGTIIFAGLTLVFAVTGIAIVIQHEMRLRAQRAQSAVVYLS